MRLTPIATPQIRGPRNGGGVSFRTILGTGPQGLPGPGSAAWAASTAVTTGAVRQAPDGSWIKSTADRTTRASFDATEQGFWEPVLASDGTLEATALSAAYARPGAALRTDFSTKADAAAPATGDDGVAVTLNPTSGEGLLLVKDGLLQTPTLTGVTKKAAYWQQPLVGAKRIGGEFVMGPNSEEHGNVTLVFWEYLIPTPYYVPNSPLHLSFTETYWRLSVWEGGTTGSMATETMLITEFYDTPLTVDWDPDVDGSGTVYRVEALIVDDTAIITLPDGSIATVTDSRIASIPANVACHEVYRNAAGSSEAAFRSIWADTRPAPVGGSTSLSETAQLVNGAETRINAALPDWAPVVVQRAPTPAADITVPGSNADMDATNIAVTLTLPEGCTAVEVEFTAYLSVTASSRVLWSFAEGATGYDTQSVIVGAYTGNVTYRGKRTGMTPGQAYTLKMKHFYTGGSGATLKLDSPNGYKATMKVTPLVS